MLHPDNDYTTREHVLVQSGIDLAACTLLGHTLEHDRLPWRPEYRAWLDAVVADLAERSDPPADWEPDYLDGTMALDLADTAEWAHNGYHQHALAVIGLASALVHHRRTPTGTTTTAETNALLRAVLDYQHALIEAKASFHTMTPNSITGR